MLSTTTDPRLTDIVYAFCEAVAFTTLPEDQIHSGEFGMSGSDILRTFDSSQIDVIVTWCNDFQREAIAAHNNLVDQVYDYGYSKVETFDQLASDLYYGYCSYPEEFLAGHDLWMTANGHGTGFWAGHWEDDILSDTVETLGISEAYIGDDNKIWFVGHES